MIQVNSLSKSFSSQVLFSDSSFSVGKGERIGLIGRNGHGKSTLLKMIAGEVAADGGEISSPKGYKIGHLSQRLDFNHVSVIEECSSALPTNEGGWKETYQAESILSGLGFTNEMQALTPAKLSGGYQVRLQLAKLLVSKPDMLLLDEPSNYLDIVSIRWLTRFLRTWDGEMFLVTHERGFMDSIITHCLGIHRGGIRKIPGKTAKFYEQIALEEEVHEKTRLNQEKKRAQTEEFIDRFRAKASKAKAVQSKIKGLAKQEKLEALNDISNLNFSFNHAPINSKWILRVDNLDFAYEETTPLIQSLSFSVGKSDRIGIVGKNGKGKTTLLNLIAEELAPTSGTINPASDLETQYFGQTNVDRLEPRKTVEEEIQSANPDLSRTAVRNICGSMLFNGDLATKQISVLSGGERSRVLLGKVLSSPASLLLLDEPTNHLDMESTAALTDAIAAFPGAVLMVTHSEEMLRHTVNKLVVFDGKAPWVFDGDYDDFLSRVGWEEEPKKESSTSGTLSKKELRKKKAEIIQQRSQNLGPLKKELEKLEKEILALEQKSQSQTEELIEMSKDGYGDEAAKLSRLIHQTKQKIEESYEALTEKTIEYEAASEDYDSKIESLKDE